MVFNIEISGAEDTTIRQGERQIIRVFTDRKINAGSPCRVELQQDGKPNIIIHDGSFMRPPRETSCSFYWTPNKDQIGSWELCAYDHTGYPSRISYVTVKDRYDDMVGGV